MGPVPPRLPSPEERSAAAPPRVIVKYKDEDAPRVIDLPPSQSPQAVAAQQAAQPGARGWKVPGGVAAWKGAGLWGGWVGRPGVAAAKSQGAMASTVLRSAPLCAAAEVEYAEPDQILYITAANPPNDPLEYEQWHLPQVRALLEPPSPPFLEWTNTLSTPYRPAFCGPCWRSITTEGLAGTGKGCRVPRSTASGQIKCVDTAVVCTAPQVDAYAAWETSTGSAAVKVCVVDTGVKYK